MGLMLMVNASHNPSGISPDQLYSVREAAEVLSRYESITPDTVREKCRKGEINARKMGPKGIWKITGRALEDLIESWGHSI